MHKKISILGCGWLGLPLAKELIRQGHVVSGSTTSPEKIKTLSQTGICPYLINLTEPVTLSNNPDFFYSETLIIAVPPRRNSGDSYPSQIRKLTHFLNTMPASTFKIIYVSSTSVYKASVTEITESSDLDFENALEMIEAENSILSLKKQQSVTIIRFAGLFGPNRAPGKFLAGKINLPDPDAPVNLIGLKDCIAIISEIIRQEKWNEIYNACADEHPTRKAFYKAAALNLNLPEPEFTTPNSTDLAKKLISNAKLKRDLNYKFIYPDPLSALKSKTVLEVTKNTN